MENFKRLMISILLVGCSDSSPPEFYKFSASSDDSFDSTIFDSCFMSGTNISTAIVTVVSTVQNDACPNKYNRENAQVTVKIDQVLLGEATENETIELRAFYTDTSNVAMFREPGDQLLITFRDFEGEQNIIHAVETETVPKEVTESGNMTNLPSDPDDLKTAIETAATSACTNRDFRHMDSDSDFATWQHEVAYEGDSFCEPGIVCEKDPNTGDEVCRDVQ